MSVESPALTAEALDDMAVVALAVALRGACNLEELGGFEVEDLALVLTGTRAYRALCELPNGHPGRDSTLALRTRAERALMEAEVIRDCAHRHRSWYARVEPASAEVARAERVLAALGVS